MKITHQHLEGIELLGNDLSGEDLEKWYEEEERGFYNLVAEHQSQVDEVVFNLDTVAINRFHGSYLPDRDFDQCVAIGCANGADVIALNRKIAHIIAIEPCREWWSDSHGGIPFSYRAPTLTGVMDLPDSSVDLVVALGALHHVATVETVVREMVRVLKPGGWLIIREPITSMGDFRALRIGLTRFERGIPFQMMKEFIESSDARLVKTIPCSFQAATKAFKIIGIEAHNHPWLVRLDYLLSRVFMINSKYWRPTLIDKIAPTSMVYIASKGCAAT